MDNKPVQGVPIRADISSKEEKYARIKRNSAPPSAKRSSIEISQDFMKMNEGKKPSDFTMRRASGQTKIYKAVVDIDFGETSAEKVSPVSSTRSISVSNEHVVVAHVEPHTPKPYGYSDNLYVSTSTRSSHPTGGGSMAESPGIHANGAMSPSSSSIVSSQAQYESQYAGKTGYIDLANTKLVYAHVDPQVKQDDVMSQASTLASATAGFNFLDNLDVCTPTHSSMTWQTPSHPTSTPSPPATPKSTRSDISESSGTREGFYSVNSLNTSKESDSSDTRGGVYEVNPNPDPQLASVTVHHTEQPSSGEIDYATDSLRRRALGLPPLFNAPPPPLDPPPLESDVNEALGDLEEWVTEISSANVSAHNDSHNSTSSDVLNNSGSSAGSGVVRYTHSSSSLPNTTCSEIQPTSNDISMGATDEVTLTNELVYETVSLDKVDSFFTSSTAHLPEYDPNGYQKPTYLVNPAGSNHVHNRNLHVHLDKHHKSLGKFIIRNYVSCFVSVHQGISLSDYNIQV